jgi:hypothetical protein
VLVSRDQAEAGTISVGAAQMVDRLATLGLPELADLCPERH